MDSIVPNNQTSNLNKQQCKAKKKIFFRIDFSLFLNE